MQKIKDILKAKRTISFELFPPKTPEGEAKLFDTIASLSALKPDFFSCTYGAGGSSRGKTLDIVDHIQRRHGLTAMAHLTCVSHSKTEIAAILKDMQQRGIHNILALRGDPPKDKPADAPGPDSFRYSSDLITYIRATLGPHATIAAAGFPEGHVLAKDKDSDAHVLKQKVLAGADFIITQLFFDNQDYADYVKRLTRIGVTVPIIPGILPITDYAALQRFCALCGATITPEVHAIFAPLKDDPAKTMQAGIDFAIRQCRDLIAQGAPGLHFYTLNKLHPTDAILAGLK